MIQNEKSMDDSGYNDKLFELYRNNENRLLDNFPGQFAWIVGDEIKVFPNQRELCIAIMGSGGKEKGYTVKIEDNEPPICDVPSPEVY